MSDVYRHAAPSPGNAPSAVPVAALSSNGANMRFARHAQLLARWPVLDEPWAQAVERRRVEAVDRTPGPATFGR